MGNPCWRGCKSTVNALLTEIRGRVAGELARKFIGCAYKESKVELVSLNSWADIQTFEIHIEGLASRMRTGGRLHTERDVVLLQLALAVRLRLGEQDRRVRLTRGREGGVVDAGDLGTEGCRIGKRGWESETNRGD